MSNSATFARILACALATAGVLFVGSQVATQQADAQGRGGPEVTIVNPLPLPVTGTVTSAVTGSVAITNTPLPVTVTNQQAAMTPFQTTLCITVGLGGSQCGTTPAVFVVPSGRRLVIEYASGLCPPSGTSLPTGLDVTGALLQTVAGGTTATHLFQIAPGLSIGGLNGFAVAQQTRIYADQATNVTLGVEVGGLGNGNLRCQITISGNTVGDVPLFVEH